MEGILGELVSLPGPEAIAQQERIAIRRARVDDKLAKKRLESAEGNGDNASGTSELSVGRSSVHLANRSITVSGGGQDEKRKEKEKKVSNSANDQLELQIEESKKQLEQLIQDGEMLITNVKAAAEYREKIRHDRQDQTRKHRILELKDDAEYCQNEYNDISSKWLINAEKTLPLELFEKMKAQQEACDELLRKKDDTITSLRREIEENDYEYENNLEKYQKDMILIGDRIDDHIDDLRKSFLEELELLEDYTCQDREYILEENQKEWLKLLEEYETMEVKNLEESKSDAIEKFQLLNDMYANAKQGFREAKQELEDDLRILIQEVEQVKVICQLNLDKMDYNLHVLRRREDENRKLKNAMKRKLLKLQDLFSEKTSSYQAMIVDAKAKSRKLIKEIERLEQQCATGSRKTLELVTNDYRKYTDMWIVNEEMGRAKLQKLVDSEKFIYETQLGIELPVLDMDSLDNRPPEIQKFLRRIKYIPPNRQASDIYETFNDDFGSEDGAAEGSFESIVRLKGAGNVQPSEYKAIEGNNYGENPPESQIDDLMEYADDDPKVLRSLMKHISKICNQSGFIIEEKLRRILAPLQDLEQQLIRADSLFQALGVTEISQLKILAKYILKYCKVKKTYASKSASIGTDESIELFVSKEDVTPEIEKKESLKDEINIKVETLSDILGRREKDRNSDAKTEVANITKSIEVELGVKFDDNGDIIEKDEKTFDNESKQERTALMTTDSGEIREAGSNESSSSCSSSSYSGSTYDTSCGSTGSAGSNAEAIAAIRRCREAKLHPEDLNETTEGKALSEWNDDSMLAAKKKYQKQRADDESDEVFNQRKSIYQSPIEEAQIMSPEDEEYVATTQRSPEKDHHDDQNNQHRISGAGHQHHDHHHHDDHSGSSHEHHHHEHHHHEHHHHDHHEHHTHHEGHHEHHGHHHGHHEGHPRHHDESEEEKIGSRSTGDDDYDDNDDVYSEESEKSSSEGSKLSSTPSPSTVSIPTTMGESTETVYIQPGDILDALTEFCQDFNTEIKQEIPTEEDIINKKLSMMQFPDPTDTTEYWNLFYSLTDPKSKELWESIQYCFERYADVLKKRNDLIEEIVQLYQQNFELSHLLKKHLQRSVRFSSKQDPSSVYRSNIPYC